MFARKGKFKGSGLESARRPVGAGAWVIMRHGGRNDPAFEMLEARVRQLLR